MSTAAVVVLGGETNRSSRRRAPKTGAPTTQGLSRLISSSLRSGLDETVVIVRDAEAVKYVPDGATVLLDDATELSEATALRAATDYCARSGHEAIVVHYGKADSTTPTPEPQWWQVLADATKTPIVLGFADDEPVGLARIDATAWPLLPLDGDIDVLWHGHPELTSHHVLETPSATGASVDDDDRAVVERLLGRTPNGGFRVIVRDVDGEPIVIENEPFLDDGTPMPTRYWLVGARERRAVGRLEAEGGTHRAEEAVPADEIAQSHVRYAAVRDAAIAPDHVGPRPDGGVGGTRVGVKCLHAHLAYYLVGGGDPVGRWVATMLQSEITGPVAAIDCGTNSTRLLVLDRSGAQVERLMTITRLGQGVDETGALAPEAIERTIAALVHYREVMDRHGVVSVRAAATSAARDAENADTFFDAGEQALGVRPELLDGREEGRLSYLGATGDLPIEDGPFLVVDLGGGSTELVTSSRDATDGDVVAVSLPMGCVRMTERYLASDPPTPGEIDEARAAVRAILEEVVAANPIFTEAPHLVGVAGTVAALVTLDAGHDAYDAEKAHGRHLERASVESLLISLATQSAAERRRRPGLEPARADVIVGGALVLAEVMAVCGFEELVYSEKDILDGLARSILG